MRISFREGTPVHSLPHVSKVGTGSISFHAATVLHHAIGILSNVHAPYLEIVVDD